MTNKNCCNVRVSNCRICGEDFCKHHSTAMCYAVCYECAEEAVKKAVGDQK